MLLSSGNWQVHFYMIWGWSKKKLLVIPWLLHRRLDYVDYVFEKKIWFLFLFHRETLRDILQILRNTGNPQVEYIIRIMKKWAKDNRVPVSWGHQEWPKTQFCHHKTFHTHGWEGHMQVNTFLRKGLIMACLKKKLYLFCLWVLILHIVDCISRFVLTNFSTK